MHMIDVIKESVEGTEILTEQSFTDIIYFTNRMKVVIRVKISRQAIECVENKFLKLPNVQKYEITKKTEDGYFLKNLESLLREYGKFASVLHAGPKDVADFLDIEDEEKIEMIKRDAYE